MMDVADVNQRNWLEESRLWLENVDWTHLVLTSKPFYRKVMTGYLKQDSILGALLSDWEIELDLVVLGN